MTGQVELDSYRDAGVLTSVLLVNAFATEAAFGRRVVAADPQPELAKLLAFDAKSLALLTDRDVPGFVALAGSLRPVFGGDLDAAANRLNELLATNPAHPHLALEDGRWRMHHHPVDAGLVPMYTAICAEALARMISTGFGERLGQCTAIACDRVFFDSSKNASRRFCSTACQNRTKAAAFRRRRAS